MKITVIYYGDHDQNLDRIITTSLEESGFIWRGQGYNLQSGKRDISFSISKNRVKKFLDKEIKNES